MIALNRAVAEGGSLPSLQRARDLLRSAIDVDYTNQSAWRALGLVQLWEGDEDGAIEAWNRAGDMLIELQAWAQKTRRAEHYEEALQWYGRAGRLEDPSGDIWVGTGEVNETRGDWHLALEAYEQALLLPLRDTHRSDIYYRIGWIQLHQTNPPDLNAALVAFDSATSEDDYSSDNQYIDGRYARAEVLRQLNRGGLALLEYEWVVQRQPDNYWALLYLASLSWQEKQDFVRAEELIQRAIQSKPGHKWAYRALARIYEQSSRLEKAIAFYQQVLDLDPLDELARERLKALSAVD